MIRDLIASFSRAFIQVIAGMGLANGLYDAAGAETLVNAGLIIASLVWSFIDKSKSSSRATSIKYNN